MNTRSAFRKHAPLAVCILLFAAMGTFSVVRPTDFYWLGFLLLAALYAVYAISWDIFSGFTGEINFGHSFFIGLSAYAASLLCLKAGWKIIPSVAAGALLASAAGFLVGLLSLRLRGPFFSMLTLVLAGLLSKLALFFSKYTGGEEGLAGLPSLTSEVRWDFMIVLVFAAFSFAILYLLGASRFGRILKSIRHSPDFVEASGINVTFYKVTALTISGFFAGLAGAVYPFTQMHVGLETVSVALSTNVLVMALVGGMGTVTGPLAGAIGMTVLDELLRKAGEARFFIYWAVVVTVIFVSPSGIFGGVAPLMRLRRLLGRTRD